MDINEATAKAIAAERSAAGLTIKDLSEKSGVPERTLIRMLKNERDIKVTQIAQLSEVFGINPHELIEEAEKFVDRANRAKAREREFRVTDELVDRIASRPEDFDVAANDDPNKTLEAETPRD